MLRFREALNEMDRSHLQRILGEREDPTFSGTKRRLRVNQIATDEMYVADGALEPFGALPQGARERLISDVVWQVTCYVEGSVARNGHFKGVPLECGFLLVRIVQDGRPAFCVEKGP